ncbi:hypothetical protein FISHEDRAFT_61945 [Fistulina hepatica ATCC 64428]|uniref:Uncharacterized protein n=1 Tax=Fistulina hepatica ATCC 64428 TaxID=1128425 RepID=A0A0D7A0U8_9AGAR|nr:hypothetical protein FISHEDRAFT_61945 [Fistulina hepatica ATCC 64428]
MSHSTTSTSSFVLARYSKSCLTAAQAAESQDSGAEWQHFVNPVIRLVLDIRRTSGGTDLASVRLRIVWSMDADSSSQSLIQQDVVFSQRQNPRGPPLKAVYRDAVVGMRYLHATSPGATPQSTPGKSYRRFQITFNSASAATEFIERIRTVCPCKASAMSAVPTSTQPFLTSASTTMMPAIDTFVTPSKSVLSPSPLSLLSSAPSHHAAGVLDLRKSHAQTDELSSLTGLSQSSSHLAASPALAVLHPTRPGSSLASDILHSTLAPNSVTPSPLNRTSDMPSVPAMPSCDAEHRGSMLPPPPRRCAPDLAPTQTDVLPPVTVNAMPPLALPLDAASVREPPNDTEELRSTDHFCGEATNLTTQGTLDAADTHIKSIGNQATGSLFASLRSVTGLYNLPNHELEKLVGDVVREDGFVDLTESTRCILDVGGDAVLLRGPVFCKNCIFE